MGRNYYNGIWKASSSPRFHSLAIVVMSAPPPPPRFTLLVCCCCCCCCTLDLLVCLMLFRLHRSRRLSLSLSLSLSSFRPLFFFFFFFFFAAKYYCLLLSIVVLMLLPPRSTSIIERDSHNISPSHYTFSSFNKRSQQQTEIEQCFLIRLLQRILLLLPGQRER
jgi:hypothetical protein